MKQFVVGCLALFFVMVVFRINVSNMREYSRIIPKNIAEAHVITIGKSRGIRSDEWLCALSRELYASSFPAKNVKGVYEFAATFVNPYNWGYLILPQDMAYSFATLLPYFLLFFFGLFFIKIFVKDDNLLAIISSFVLVFSPAVSWWNSAVFYANALAIIVFFYWFFNTGSIVRKILCSSGLVFFSSSLLLGAVYPAWQIPLIYLIVFILLGIFFHEQRINFRKTDMIYIAVSTLLILIVGLCYYLSSKEFIELVSNTVYPGKRIRSGGGLDLGEFAFYYLNMLSPYSQAHLPINQSEVSRFLSFFPVPMLLYLFNFRQLKRQKIFYFLFGFMAICLIYMCFGFPQIVSKLSLFAYSTTHRLYLIFDFCSLLFLLLVIAYTNTNEIKIRSLCLFFVSLLAYFSWIVLTQKQIIKYLGFNFFILICIVLLVFSFAVLTSRRLMSLYILAVLTVFSGFVVNPANFGLGIMTKTPIAKVLREIDRKEKGNWITVNDGHFCKYITAQGIDCFNTLNYPPKMAELHKLDPSGVYEEVYNRYAHVNVKLTDEPTSFILNYTDVFTIMLNIGDLKKLDIKYIGTKDNLSEISSPVHFEELYFDPLDGFRLYRVEYLH